MPALRASVHRHLAPVAVAPEGWRASHLAKEVVLDTLVPRAITARQRGISADELKLLEQLLLAFSESGRRFDAPFMIFETRGRASGRLSVELSAATSATTRHTAAEHGVHPALEPELPFKWPWPATPKRGVKL